MLFCVNYRCLAYGKDAMMALSIKKLIRAFQAFLAFVILLLPVVSHAYSAVAGADGNSATTYVGGNFPTQKIADSTALNGCRTAAKEAGLSKLATNCKVWHRQKGAGAGAVVWQKGMRSKHWLRERAGCGRPGISTMRGAKVC